MKKLFVTILLSLSVMVVGCGNTTTTKSDETSNVAHAASVEETTTSSTEDDMDYELEDENARGNAEGLSYEQKLNLRTLAQDLYEAEQQDTTVKEEYKRTIESIDNDILNTCDVYGYDYACDYANKSIKEHKDKMAQPQNNNTGNKTYQDPNNIDYYIVKCCYFIDNQDYQNFMKWYNPSTPEELWDKSTEAYKQLCRQAFRQEWKAETGNEFNPTTFQMSQDLFKGYTSQFYN